MIRTSLVLSLLLIAMSPEEGHWEILNANENIESRSECGMAAVDGKLYLMGGDGEILPVEEFDPATRTWTEKAKTPVEMHHFEAVGYDHKVYVLDAFYKGNFPNQKPMPGVYIYDTQNDNWSQGAGLPEGRRRAGAGAAVHDGKLYLVDGIKHGHSSGTNNMFDVYDPVADRWDSLPDAPHIRDHCSAAVIGDKLYVAGGRNTSYHEEKNFVAFFSKTVLEVDCYDFGTGKWSTLAAKLPLGSGGGALVNFNGVLYYMGGERATNKEQNAPRSDVFYLDPASGKEWKKAENMHMRRNGMAAAVLDNKIYVFGGDGGPGIPAPPPQASNSNGAMPAMPHGPLPMRHLQAPLEVFMAN